MRHEAVIGVGSNIDPLAHIPRGLDALSDAFDVSAMSMRLWTPAIGAVSAPDYINTAALITTDVDQETVRRTLHQIEYALGRRRTADRNAPRTIDLDILTWDDCVVDDAVATRPFLQSAICEVAPSVHLPPDFREQEFGAAAITDTVESLVRLRNGTVFAVYGAGHWFKGEAAPGSDVDLVVVTGVGATAVGDGFIARADRTAQPAAEALAQVLRRPVSVRHIDLSQFAESSFRPTELLPAWPVARVYARQASHWKLLAGDPLDVTSATLPTEQEVGWSAATLDGLREQFEKQRVTVSDVARHYLYHRALSDYVDGLPYATTFSELRHRYRDARDALVHTAVAARLGAPWMSRNDQRGVVLQLSGRQKAMS